MKTPKEFYWDYERSPWDSNHGAVTFSVGVFQWLPKTSGKGLKKSKSIRIMGFVAESERAYKMADELCEKLNQEGIQADNPPNWLQKQYSLPQPAVSVTAGSTDGLSLRGRPNHKKALLGALAPDFKQACFKKKSATWHRMNADTIEVFNVQCSQWSETYYFNVGIYLRALGSSETPLECECHIRDRVPNSEWHGDAIWDRACKLHDFDPPPLARSEWLDFDPETRICELKKLIVPLALDWLARFRELEAIRQEIRSRGRQLKWATRDVYQLFGLPAPN